MTVFFDTLLKVGFLEANPKAIRSLIYLDLFSWFFAWVSAFSQLNVFVTFCGGSENGQPQVSFA